jgi:hypothetical protein
MTTNLTGEPQIKIRDPQTYVGMRRTITMQTFPEIADRIPELFTWLVGKKTAAVGPPFLRLNVIDMAADLEVEAGVPVAEGVFDENPVFVGVLPAGRYLSYVHVGHPEGTVDAVAAVFAWAQAQGLVFDRFDAADGQHWAARLEVLLTNPAEEPDMTKWATDLQFKLAD